MSLQNIVNTIMSKIPVYRLKCLRQELERAKGGLEVEAFIAAVVQNMELDSEEQLLQTVPELVDLFEVIDINGDGGLEWKEFVSFLIDQVVSLRAHDVNERLVTVSHDSTEAFDSVHCCKIYFGKLFVATGNSVVIYSLDASSSSWLSDDSARIVIEGPEAFEGNLRQDNVRVLDFAFIDEDDVLIMLRSDKYLHSVRFTTRAKLTSDSLFFMGIFQLPHHCTHICVSILPKEPCRLFASSISTVVDTWTINIQPAGKVTFEEHSTLEEIHTDFIRDILVLSNSRLKLLITGSLDKTWAAYDLSTLHLKYRRSGLTNGIRSLAYDGKALLLIGCLDFSIAAYDLDSELDFPLFIMKGHTSVVTKIVALPIERCFSLDAGGEIRYWDISMNDIDNRFVSSKLRAEDRFHSFDVFTGLSTLFDAVNNIAVAALGRLTHMYKLVDTSPVEDPPVAILFSYELLTIVTVHPRDLFLWNVVSGELIQRIHNIGGASSSDVTSATLNTKGQKIFCGHSSGSLSIYNAYNGYHMHTVLIAPSAPIRFMSYSPEKVLFILCGNADLYALDDGDEFCSESILRVNRIADRFIVSMSYSNALGVVALADSQDVLMFFDMEFFTLELTINQVTGGSKIGQVTFLGDYPLLLVCGNNGTFVIVPIDLTKLRIPVWRVTPSTDELKPFIDSRENAMLSKDRVNAFLKTRNNVKSIGAFIYHGPVYEDEESVYKIAIRKSLASMNSFETEIKKIVHLTQPQEQIDNVKVVVGYESGACGIFDFSRALRSIGMPKLKPADFACTRDSFDPRRRVEKATTEFSLERTSMLKTSVRRNEKRAACYCDCIWQAHVGPVVSVMLMRHNKHILTASEDRNVKFWSIESQLKGTLTRGTKTDKVMALGWTSPIDAAARQQEKQELALILKKKLGLRLAKFNAHDRKSKKMSIISNVFHGINPLQSSIGGSSLVSPSISSTAIYQLPDRIRTIGQLHGGITYKQSTKDFHRSIVGSPRTQLANSISKLEAKITQKAPLKRQKKKKNQETIVINSTVEDTEYLESVLESTKLYESDTIGSTKTRYDAEIQRFDAADPLNWDISSNNKQREIYANLHRELTTKGLTRDQILILEQKLNVLSPGGNFIEYLATLKRDLNQNRENGKIFVMPTGIAEVPTSPVVPRLNISEVAATYGQRKESLSPPKVSMAHSTSSLSQVSHKMKMSVTNSRHQSNKTLEPLLPFQMQSGLTEDLKKLYKENHEATVDVYDAFLNKVNSAEKEYRKMRRRHKKQMKLKRETTQLKPLHRTSSL